MNEIEIEIKDKKKTIVGITIGMVSLLIMVIGAAYAYWNAKGIVNFNTATISYETEDKSLIILNGTSANLTLGAIIGDDMVKMRNDVVYYAGTENKTTTPTEVTLGVVSYDNKNDINNYRCQFTLSLTHSGTADIINRFLSETNGEPDYENRSAGQIILTVNGVEYDLNDGFPSTITGYVDVNGKKDVPINVGLKFVNLKNVDQEYLINTNGMISINVASNGFTCESTGTTVYWAYEYNNSNTPIYANTAQKKVADYHDLQHGITTFKADVALVFNNGIFSTLADCETSSQGYNSSYYSNLVCYQSPSTGYIINLSFVYQSLDTEQECTAYTSYVPNSHCEHNSTTEKWDLIFVTKLPVETLQKCQEKVAFAESAISEMGAEAELSCSLASNTPTFYYQIGEFNEKVADRSTCDNMITIIEEADDINDLMDVQEFNYLGVNTFLTENSRCEQPQIPIFVKETKILDSETPGVYNTNYQICGVFGNDSLLCYNPEGITTSNIQSLAALDANYFNCSMSGGNINCVDNDDYYKVQFTLENNIYTSSLFNIMSLVGCGYDGSDISCYTRTPVAVVETTTHSPIPDTTGTTTYYENTFTGATSITVKLAYQTRSDNQNYNYISLYKTDSSTLFNTYFSYDLKTETVIVPGDYIKIDWYNRYSSSYYIDIYGFKAEIYPNY